MDKELAKFLEIDVLCESPRFSSPDEFGLDDHRMNETKAKILLADKNCKLVSKSLNLYKVCPDEDGKNVMFITGYGGKVITYYVSWEIEKLSLLPKESITQVAVWKSVIQGNTAMGLFWKYIFSKTKLAVSDRVQTEDGKRFWMRAVDQAVKKGYYCYLLNFKRKRVIELDKGNDSFFKLSHTSYGDYSEHELYRWCISAERIRNSVKASGLK